jgi:hypothetical protein
MKHEVLFFEEVDRNGELPQSPLYVFPNESWNGDANTFTAFSDDGFVPCAKDYILDMEHGENIVGAVCSREKVENMKKSLKHILCGEVFEVMDSLEYLESGGNDLIPFNG